VPVLLQFQWMMQHSASEAKCMAQEVTKVAELIGVVCIDSKADDEKMFTWLKTKQAIKLLTVPRSKMDKSEQRKQMIAEQIKIENRQEIGQGFGG
jgi:site-specific DNA-adenine methylase